MGNVIDLNKFRFPYRSKVIVFFNHDYLMNNYTAEFLEDNRVFAICFDTTPKEILKNMRDYKEVIKYFPNSSRVLNSKTWIGSFEIPEWKGIIHRHLEILFGPDYEIYDWEDRYTDVHS